MSTIQIQDRYLHDVDLNLSVLKLPPIKNNKTNTLVGLLLNEKTIYFQTFQKEYTQTLIKK